MTSPYHPAPQDPVPESTPAAHIPGDEAVDAHATSNEVPPAPPVPPVQDETPDPVTPDSVTPATEVPESVTPDPVTPAVAPVTNYLQQPAASGYAPAAPSVAAAPIYRYPASPLHAGIRGGAGALLVVGAIIMGAFGAMFPYNAPVEQLLNFGLIMVLVAAGLVLMVFAAITISRMSRPTVPGRTSPLAVTAFALTLIGASAWLVSVVPTVAVLFEGERLKYMGLTGGLFFVGFLWGTGIVMGVLSLRAAGGKSRLYAGLSVGLGALLLIGAVAPAVIYGLGLSD